MRVIALFVGLWLGVSVVFAQDEQPNTLLGQLDFGKLGMMVAADYRYSGLAGEGLSMLGLRSGLTLGNSLAVGGFYQFQLNQPVPASEVGSGLYLNYWSVGGFVEYTLLADRMVSFSFPLLIGLGEVEMDSEDAEPRLGERNFLVVEPSALVELRLTKQLRLSGGLSYRLAGNFDYRQYSQEDVNSLGGQVGLKFTL